MKKYLITVYGKNGCDKCIELKKNVNMVIEMNDVGNEFAMDYQNLSTIEGMQAYAIAETINGQRIPALQVMKYSEEKEAYVKIPNPVSLVDTCGKIVPYHLQLETDYSSENSSIGLNKIKELISFAQKVS